jgi:hypothetical protein
MFIDLRRKDIAQRWNFQKKKKKGEKRAWKSVCRLFAHVRGESVMREKERETIELTRWTLLFETG